MMRSTRASVSAGLGLLLLLSMACGASQGTLVRSPFTAHDAALFEDGLDMLEDPGALQGEWRRDWEREVLERTQRSDLIVEGALITVRSDVDPDQSTRFGLVLRVKDVLRGELSSKELSLSSSEDALGYATIERHPERTLQRSFIAFVKYAPGSPRPIAHFHLTPPSKAVREQIARVSEGDSSSVIKVTTHSD